jgi:hypothetical protein
MAPALKRTTARGQPASVGQNTKSSTRGESLASEANFLDHLSPQRLRSILPVVLPFDQGANHAIESERRARTLAPIRRICSWREVGARERTNAIESAETVTAATRRNDDEHLHKCTPPLM